MLENYKYAEYDQRQYIKGCPYIIPWYNKNEESWQKGPTLTINENLDLYWLSQRNANKQYTPKGMN